MRQSLSIGITDLQPGWKRILEQEGLPWRECSLGKPVKPAEFALIIISGRLGKKQAQNALEFAGSGGALLVPYGFAKHLLPDLDFKEHFVKFIQRPHGVFFHGTGLTWLHGKAAVFEGHKAPVPTEKRVGKGRILVLPFDPNEATLDGRYERRGFFAKKAFPAEFAPMASKRNVRTIAMNCIRALFDARDLPLVQKWYYPHSYKSVFSFHIDVDCFDNDTLTTIALMNRLGIPALWFPNMEAACKSPDPAIMRELKKQPHMGQHAFEHNYFSDSLSAYKNALKGDREAKKAGLAPQSFSAPNGVWGPGIALAVEKTGYPFAMGFALDGDNLPFYPMLSACEQAKFLFLPTHPVCIGMLKSYDFSEKDMVHYFRMVIERNSALNLPIFLYSHPFKEMARFPRVVEEIASDIRARHDIWLTDHASFAGWWKKRGKISFSAAFDGRAIMIRCKNAPGASLAITMGSKRYLVRAKNQSVKPHALVGGEQLFRHIIRDTVQKPSGFGKKYLLKKAAGHGLNLVRKVRKKING